MGYSIVNHSEPLFTCTTANTLHKHPKQPCRYVHRSVCPHWKNMCESVVNTLNAMLNAARSCDVAKMAINSIRPYKRVCRNDSLFHVRVSRSGRTCQTPTQALPPTRRHVHLCSMRNTSIPLIVHSTVFDRRVRSNRPA
jgi:hypothetical protein